MRSIVLALLVPCSWGLHAQNWALVNPAYKYNFSNDGTDTISNQVFVTHIDTLGPDSFRYVLNRIAQPCSNCGDTCNIRVNLPQFLFFECISSGAVFHIGSEPALLIRTQAPLGGTWMFDPLNMTEGMITDVTVMTVFNASDSVKTMTTALGDTVRWSRNHGILKWHLHDGPSNDLVGVQGPDNGGLIPTLAEFFPFHPGDVVEYSHGNGDGWDFYSTKVKLYVDDREENDGQLIFSGQAHIQYIVSGVPVSDWQGPQQWVVDTNSLPAISAIGSAPGALVNIPITGQSNMYTLARHHINSNGSYVIQGEAIYPDMQVFTMGSIEGRTCIEASWPGPCGTGLVLTEGLGLQLFGYCIGGNAFEFFSTQGAVVDGDTIGTVHDDWHFHIGMDEMAAGIGLMYPNPASDFVHIPGAEPSTGYRLVDTSGRQITTGIFSEQRAIDVRLLEEGSYAVFLKGQAVQRFIIARP